MPNIGPKEYGIIWQTIKAVDIKPGEPRGMLAVLGSKSVRPRWVTFVRVPYAKDSAFTTDTYYAMGDDAITVNKHYPNITLSYDRELPVVSFGTVIINQVQTALNRAGIRTLIVDSVPELWR